MSAVMMGAGAGPPARKRTALGAVLMALGVGLVILGSALAWNTTALLGFAIGSVGLLAICLGAIAVRQGMVGHFVMGNGTVEDDVDGEGRP